MAADRAALACRKQHRTAALLAEAQDRQRYFLFKNFKGDLANRPVFHRLEGRIEAHIFIAFVAYCLHVSLGRRLHALAPGLTARGAIEKFAAVQMIDLHVPTTDGRELMLARYTEPEPELNLLLDKLRLVLPAQPQPRITAEQTDPAIRCSANL